MSQRMLDAITILVCTAIVLMGALFGGCGGEGGDANGRAGTQAAAGGDGTTTPPAEATLACSFGDNNSFTFNVGDNSSLAVCTDEGGTVKPDNSSIDEHPNNSTTIVNPTPTPTSS